MPKLIEKPSRVTAAGNKPKLIDEYVGHVNSGHSELSVAHMRSPSGWVEPGQRPDFDEYTLVLKGRVHVEFEGGELDVREGQAVLASRGEWVRYSTPDPEGAEYVAICLPAFTLDTAHRDPAELERLIATDAVLASVASEVRRRFEAEPHDAAHDLRHAHRVALWTLRIAGDRVPARLAVLAALLHDVVNVPKTSPDRARASELCAGCARELLATHALAADDIELVAEAITDHSFSRGAVPRSELGRALQDADRLEALGALGLMRCISTGVSFGADYFHPDDPWAEQRELEDLRYSVDHFYTKLLGLAATMQTDLGRREAERRSEFLRVFLRQLGSEIGSEPHFEKNR